MKIAIDLGNGYTKLMNGDSFPSRVKVGKKFEINKKDKSLQVSYDNVDYIVGGETGALSIGEEKYEKVEYEVCLMTAIALSSEDALIEANLVVGLPWENYTRQKDMLKKRIEKIGQKKITVNGDTKIIRIIACEVFVEGALPFLLQDIIKEDEKSLVIDMGMGTINISLWEGIDHVDHSTFPMGMLKLYSEIAKKINEPHGTRYLPIEVRKLIYKNSITNPRGEKVDISWIKNDVQNFINEVVSFINGGYPSDRIDKVFLIGGGGMDTVSYWENEYKDRLDLYKDAQFANVKVYEYIASEVFEDDNE